MGDDVTLVSSAEETAKDVYRVLADADAAAPGRPAAAQPRVRHHRRPARSSSGSAAGSSAPRWCRPRPRPWPADEADRRRVLRLAGRSGLAGVLLPRQAEHDGPHLAPRARPRQRRRWGRCSGTSTSATSTRWSQPPAPRPLRGPVRPVRRPAVRPARPQPAARARCTVRRASPAGWPAPTTCRPTASTWAPSWTSVRCRTGDAVRGRPVHGHAVPGQPPGRGLRPAGRGRRTHAGLHRRHRQLRRAQPAVPRRHAGPGRLGVRRRPRRASRASTSPAAGRRGRRWRPGESGGWCSPTCRRGTTPRSAGPRPARSGPARSSWPRPARRTSCSPAPGAAWAPPNLGRMTRHDGRAPDQLRDVTDHPQLAGPRRGQRAGRVRPHPRAVRGLVHRRACRAGARAAARAG